ncbi:ATP-grasp domain-containing protein [Streptomyces sp. NBC_01465]|uniref:ATP-grasp domain-containing protein n=1 Tax=Streptomyces sp. NBC_01465 TaxID=2903878 RepID=UPI002E316C81|nr:carboxylase [Streptomyces sp. NBC_01465]
MRSASVYAAPTAPRPRILVVGGSPKHVRKARELGLDVVLAQFPDAYDRDHWPYVDQALLLDYGDTDRLLPMVRALHAAYPFQAAVSLFELGLLPAARINEALGLGGESVATVELLLDKWQMRRELTAKGISPVASAVGRSAQDVRAFVAAHGLPVIVKPIRESGSLGIFRIHDRADVDAVADRFRSLGDRHWDARDLTGTDSFDEFLMEDTEVKLTSRGPRIIESHNRIGGDRINELAEIAYGVDMERYALGAGFGLVEPLTASPEPRGGAAVRFLTPEPGRVVEVTGVDAVRADPACADLQLDLRPGDVVPPLTWNEDKVGHVVARGTTAAEAIAHSRRLAETILIRTEPVV